MRNRKSKKDMKISGQYKKHQRTNNDLQNTRQKLKIETFAVPVPIMTSVIPLLNINVPCILKKSSEDICIKCRKVPCYLLVIFLNIYFKYYATLKRKCIIYETR
jgi:hypothetical protein